MSRGKCKKSETSSAKGSRNLDKKAEGTHKPFRKEKKE